MCTVIADPEMFHHVRAHDVFCDLICDSNM